MSSVRHAINESKQLVLLLVPGCSSLQVGAILLNLLRLGPEIIVLDWENRENSLPAGHAGRLTPLCICGNSWTCVVYGAQRLLLHPRICPSSAAALYAQDRHVCRATVGLIETRPVCRPTSSPFAGHYSLCSGCLDSVMTADHRNEELLRPGCAESVLRGLPDIKMMLRAQALSEKAGDCKRLVVHVLLMPVHWPSMCQGCPGRHTRPHMQTCGPPAACILIEVKICSVEPAGFAFCCLQVRTMIHNFQTSAHAHGTKS